MATVVDRTLQKAARGDIETVLQKKSKEGKTPFIIAFLIFLLIASFLISSTIGRYNISLQDLFIVMRGKLFGLESTWPQTFETVLFNVRIPRIFVAMMVGASLATAGASYQGLFRNPVVSPDILGASAGAGFGAALAIILSLNSFGIEISAFVFGLGAVILSYAISLAIGRGKDVVLILVLTGMVVSNLFSSLISIAKYVADPENKLPAITFWLLGGLSSANSTQAVILFIPLLIGTVPLFLLRYKLNVLSFGDEEAQAMGVDTRKIRLIIIICATLLTTAAVSICGMIGWVGLIIPHIARLLVGPNYKVLLPVSFLIGSIFLLGMDDLARSLFVTEVPLGILTSFFGAPFFLYLLVKGKKAWL
jgi:iron complex transport system permease protein